VKPPIDRACDRRDDDNVEKNPDRRADKREGADRSAVTPRSGIEVVHGASDERTATGSDGGRDRKCEHR